LNSFVLAIQPISILIFVLYFQSTPIYASHELLYPENSNYYHFGKPKEIKTNFECLTDGSKSQYTRFYDPKGNPLGTKIDIPFDSEKFLMFGPTLDASLEYKDERLMKSKESGYDSDGREIVSIFEIVEIDNKKRPIKAKSYQFFESAEMNKKSEAIELKTNNHNEDNNEVLDYAMSDAITSQRKNASSGTNSNHEFVITTYSNNFSYKEENESMHEYKYFNNIYVQKDMVMENDKVVSTKEVAVEINDHNQIVSVMFKNKGSDEVLIHKENFYDENNRLILEEKIDGVKREYKYYKSGLLETYIKVGFLDSKIFSLMYRYPEIDSCGNPKVQEIDYEVPDFRDKNQYVPKYCKKMRRQLSYTYHEPCS